MKIICVKLIIFTYIAIVSASIDEEISQGIFEEPLYIFPKDRKEENRRVLGGTDVPTDEYPFAVALLTQNKHGFCSGSIISSTFVLTAAHCKNMFYVYKVSKDNKSKDGIFHEVVAMIPHPSYALKIEQVGTGTTVGAIQNDIALLQTKTDMIQGWVQSIGLSSMSMKALDQKEATVLGYGLRGLFVGPSIHTLHHTELELKRCPPRWTITICGVTPSNVAATRSICGGDSGGPLVYNGELIGVNSLGPAFCTSFLPQWMARSAFTFVPAYRDWIKTEMAKPLSPNSPTPIFATPTPQASISGPRVEKSIKLSESSYLKNMKFQEKVITKDVYYISGDSILDISYETLYSMLLINIIYVYIIL